MTTLTELEVAALTVWGEAAGEGFLGMRAVAWVLKNRARDGRHGTSLVSVARRPAQFTAWQTRRVARLATLLATGATPDPETYPTWATAREETALVLRGVVGDPTEGATHYYAPKEMRPPGAVPVWARGKTPCVEIGGHLFFNDVAW